MLSSLVCCRLIGNYATVRFLNWNWIGICLMSIFGEEETDRISTWSENRVESNATSDCAIRFNPIQSDWGWFNSFSGSIEIEPDSISPADFVRLNLDAIQFELKLICLHSAGCNWNDGLNDVLAAQFNPFRLENGAPLNPTQIQLILIHSSSLAPT